MVLGVDAGQVAGSQDGLLFFGFADGLEVEKLLERALVHAAVALEVETYAFDGFHFGF